MGSIDVGGKGGLGSPCRGFGGSSIDEVQIRSILANQRDIWAIEVRPLPVLIRFMAGDVGKPLARPDLKTNCPAVPKLFLAGYGFPLNGEEINKEI